MEEPETEGDGSRGVRCDAEDAVTCPFMAKGPVGVDAVTGGVIADMYPGRPEPCPPPVGNLRGTAGTRCCFVCDVEQQT